MSLHPPFLRGRSTAALNFLALTLLGTATACNRTPSPATPEAATKPASPPAASDKAAAAPTAEPVALAAPTTADFAVSDGTAGMRLSDSKWQPEPMDLLCLVRKAGQTPTQIDETLRTLTAPLGSDPIVADTLTRALDGEGRVVIRLTETTTAGAATALAETLAKRMPTGGGSLTCEVLPKGNRARVLFELVDPAGPDAATKRLSAMTADALQALRCVSRAEVLGGVEDTLYLELQTKTMADAKVDLSSLMGPLGAVPTEAPELAKYLKDTLVQPPGDVPKVPLANLIAVTTGVAGSPRNSRNGKIEVPTIAISAGSRCDLQKLSADAAQWRRNYERTAGNKDIWQLVSTAMATRIYVRAARDRAPEPESDFVERLLRLRKSPTSIGVFAARGLDGVPVSLQPRVRQGETWTVWLTDGEGQGQSTLANFRAEMKQAGWEVAALSGHTDTALYWLLDEPASAGALASDTSADVIMNAVQAAGVELLRSFGHETVRKGPARIAGSREAAAWTPAVATLDDRLTLWLDDLMRDGHSLHWTPGTTERLPKRVVLRLPQGERAQFNDVMPLLPAKAGPTPAPTLASLRQIPSPIPVEERLRWDNRPVGWLLITSDTTSPEVLGNILADGILTLRSQYATTQWWSVTLPDRP